MTTPHQMRNESQTMRKCNEELQPLQPTPRIDNHAFARRHKELWTFIKAFCLGVLVAGPELLIYMGLVSWLTSMQVTYLPDFFLFDLILRNIHDNAGHAPAVLVYAFILSTLAGQTATFVLTRKVAFRANCNAALATFLMLCLMLFTIIANGFVGPAIVALVARSNMTANGIQITSKILSMFVSTAWRYPIARFVIHRVVNKEEA